MADTNLLARQANNHHVKDYKRHIFPFLELPPEIRNQVYQSLLEHYDPHERGFNPAFEYDPAQSELFGVLDSQINTRETVRAKPTRTYTLTDTKAIFRLNKQVRQESLSLAYAAEGVWVVVSIRIRNYAKQLGRAGFPVVFHLNPDEIRNPAITIKVRLEGDQWTAPDKFVFRLVHLRELCRALNLMVNCFAMHVVAHLNSMSTVKARDEAYMTELGNAAALLRDIRYARVHAPAKLAMSCCQVMLAQPVHGMAPSMTTQSVCVFLDSTILKQSKTLAKGDYIGAESTLTETRAVMRDYTMTDPVIFRPRSRRSGLPYHKYDINSTIRKKYAAIIALLVRARYEVGKHELVIKHCNFLMTDKTIIGLPENMLGYTSVHYYRGMSHMALKSDDLAVSDLRQCLASAPPLSQNTDDSLFPQLDYKLLALKEIDRVVRM